MDYFTKLSWKMAQQHLNTVNHQIQEYRSVIKISFEIF